VQAGSEGHTFSVADDPQIAQSAGAIIVPFSREVDEEGGVSFTPGQFSRQTSSRTKDPTSGQTIARVVTTATYQMPTPVLLAIVKDTYALVDDAEQIIRKDVKRTDYQPFTYDAKGPTNSPMPTTEFSGSYRYVEEEQSDGTTAFVFTRDIEETTSFSYDEDNYLVTAATRRLIARDEALVPDALVVKQYQDTGPLVYQIETQRYAYIDQGTPENPEYVPVDVGGDSTPCSGHRPGGPNRPPGKPIGRDFGGAVSFPINRRLTISADVTARDSSGGNRHMSAADLAYIQAQQEEASGLYECELAFTALTMPAIKRGSLVQVTDVVDEDGDPIVFGIALVYDVAMRFDAKAAESISEIRAVWYEEAA